MQAVVGDRLHVHANMVGHPGRAGEIVEVRGAGGSRPTWCGSMTVTPPWCSPARTRSSSIRAGRAGRGRRKASPRAASRRRHMRPPA